jgi:serine/threonine-protein kinase HipA
VTWSEVEVWVAEGSRDRIAGTLRPSFLGRGVLASSSFEYDDDWIRDGWQISPDLPLERGRMYTPENQTLPGAFSDAAPDEWGQKIIRADNARRRSEDASLPARLGEFDYLLGVADRTRMGALRFREADRWLSEESGVANVHDLERIVQVAERYEDDEATDEDIAYLNDVATSPGGARPKANVMTERGALAIAKLPHSKDGRYDVERWEAITLTLAEGAGLRVPQWSLVGSGSGRGVLVSERFDRDEHGGRLGYMSGRSALRLGAHDDGSRETYEDFADAIAEWSSAPEADLHEMFGRIALTVLVNNVDDHWRNHGFVHDSAGWRLSPLFDVNPSRRRGVIDSRAISGDDDPADRQLTSLLAVSRTFRLRDADAAGIVRRVAETVADWERVATATGADARQREAFRATFDTPQLHWALGI